MDQIVESNTNDEMNEEFWKGHVLAAQSFSGTNREYCEVNGLAFRKLSFYKRRLGLGRPRKYKKAFVEIKPQSFVEEPPKTIFKEPKKALPDAKWLAEFALTLLSSQK